MFHKTARASSLGVFDFDREAGLFVKTAAATSAKAAAASDDPEPRIRSFYADGARALPVQDLLGRVAGLYSISDDPSHYFFEAIRANTTNAPNENHDGFHQAELLRHDVRLRIPVYYTYAGKPHHLNHKTDNPKEARGVIIDAAYNSDSPALDACPACHTRTAERKNRDTTGLHCRKCGTLVKDEFVEILVAIDAKKDPLFADYVRKGVLKSGSMGCNCLSTSCNVCGHVAYSKPEFCEHIRGGNKGSIWKRSSRGWVKVGKDEVARELGKRRVAFIADDFCYAEADDFEARKAFEYCNQVIFDEYSRVDQPADPKANQVEVLNLKAASVGGGVPTAEALAFETEALARAAVRKRKEFDVHMKAAHLVRAQGGPATTPPGLEEPNPAAPGAGLPGGPGGPPMPGGPGGGPQGPGMSVPPPGGGGATVGPGGAPGGVTELHPGGPVLIDPTPDPDMGGAPATGVDQGMGGPPNGQPTSIEDYSEQEMGGPGGPGGGEPDQMDMGEMGVMDLNVPGAEAPQGTPRPRHPGASAPPRAARRVMNFKQAYGQWTVQISEQGNARILDAAREPVLVIRASSEVAAAEGDAEARRAFALGIMRDLLENGLVHTAKKYTANFSPRFAQVVSGGMNDMENFKDHNMYGSPLAEGLSHTDMAVQLRTEGGPESTRTDATDATDMAEESRGSPPDAVDADGELDHEKKIKDISNTTSDARMDMREKRKPFSMGKNDVLQNEVHNFDYPLSGKKKGGAEAVGPREAAANGGLDLPEKWKQMDKTGPRVKFAGGKCSAVGCKSAAADGSETCAEHGKKDKDKKPWEKESSSTAEARSAERTAERLGKMAAARIARAKEEADAQVKQAQEAAVESFRRALRIVAARTAVDLEQAPLKLAAEAVLSEPREIGRDAATGEPIHYRGLDPELTRYLVAQLYEIGHADHVAMLTKRAAELMQKGDAYLIDAEADLANVRTALPPITASHVAEVDEPGLRAAELRKKANSGNLQFTPAPTEAAVAAAGSGAEKQERRAAIQQALGRTVVAGARGRLGLN